MTNGKMNWDENMKRWRGLHHGVRLTVSAHKLGGTNADDTRSTADRWFEKKKAEIDAKFDETSDSHLARD